MAQGFGVDVIVHHNHLPRLKAQGKQRASQAVRRAALATWRFSAPHTPVDTGALKANVIVDVANGGLSATVRWGQEYAVFQNEGTRGATARAGKFLVFEVNGKKVFAKKVRGVKARKFAQKGAEAAWPRFRHDMANIYGQGV